MKELVKINVTIYLYPEIFANSEIISESDCWDEISKKYVYLSDPYLKVTGPPDNYSGQQLEPTIQENYDTFIDDCNWLVDTAGLDVIDQIEFDEIDAIKSVIHFGSNNNLLGSIVLKLKVKDNPLDDCFPSELKEKALELLEINNVMNENATKAGINFWIDTIVTDFSESNTWSKAFDRIGLKLDQIRRRLEHNK